MKKSAETYVFQSEPTASFDGVRIGRIVRVDKAGTVFVSFAGSCESEVAARATGSVIVNLRASDPVVGREVLLAFENSDPDRPIIIDTMHSILDEVAASTSTVLEAKRPEDVLIDGKRVTFDAQEEIVLRCGKASITLTKAGKVLIRGAYLLNHSSGVNRIRGGSVQIN